MSEEKNTMVVLNEQGTEEEMEILFTFKDNERNKSYVLLVPLAQIEEEEVREEGEEFVDVYAFSYTENEDGSTGELNPIETQEEWDMVDEMLEAFESESLEAEEE